MEKTKFGSFIKMSRLKKGYTQKELADLLFIDVSAISKWERGITFPDITLVPEICKVLDVSEHELISSSTDTEYRTIKKDAKIYNNMKKGIFWTLNICYALALIVCFIVNVAVEHKLSWFFVVLSSVICSYMFLPSITGFFNKKKLFVWSISTFGGLVLLFLTCSIYSSSYWFMIATLGVLLGYFIVLCPIIFNRMKMYLKEEDVIKKSKYFILVYGLGIYLLILLLLVSVYIYNPFNIVLGIAIASGFFVIPLVVGILNIFDNTRKYIKPFLITSCSLFVLCGIAAVSRGIYINSTKEIRSEIVSVEYDVIKVDVFSGDLNIYLTEDESKIVYKEYENAKYKNIIQDGVLTVTQYVEPSWYDLFDFAKPTISIYINKDQIDILDLGVYSGDIKVIGGTASKVFIETECGNITFKSNVTDILDVEMDTGDIVINNANLNDITIESDTGDVKMYSVNCVNLDIVNDTGDIRLENVIASGDFNIKGDTTDIVFNKIDAANIYIKLDTGDVKGTILSSKIFVARAPNGRIDVPETIEGGICKIVTSTGDIIIKYY